MTELERAARLALETLEWHLERGTYGADIEGTATALRDALNRQHTHAEGCWSWGPAHYMCAYNEIGRLRGWKK